MLKVGQTAPEISARGVDGAEVSLSALRGRWVVLYFYPKAFTPGCSAETRHFRDNYEDLRSLGAEVIGVSTDDEATQCRFAAENRVTFPMIPDADRQITRAFGVMWPLIPLAKRVTFVLDDEGVVRAVFRHEVQVSKHLDDVFTFLRGARRAEATART